ncbi:MAG: hypothetical protein CFH01_01407 [Alphaproteobacteria bacterium MarineAlpha2_Bin1]|nr:MAG: hypothetical protein CFH01_01407 [Alphaproteobacteria bacterium MarineAlpha2_Bin1]
MKKIAIIGSGLSGLTLATNLINYAEVIIFEKSRGVGGRLATRRINDFNFDHGAQFFTVKTKEFRNLVTLLEEKNVVQRWDARFAEYDMSKVTHSHQWNSEYPHYVGVPNMNSIGKYLSKNLNIRLNTKINKITSDKNSLEVFDDEGNSQGNFDWVLFAIPPKQIIETIPRNFKYYDKIKNLDMLGCYSLLLGFDNKIELPFDAALVTRAKISWISINSTKPLRPKNFTMVINSTNKWADENMNMPDDKVKKFLLNETSKILNKNLSNLKVIDLQRWRYANISRQKLAKPLIDKENRIGVCGDWCIQGRVEFAFISSKKVVEEILDYL